MSNFIAGLAKETGGSVDTSRAYSDRKSWENIYSHCKYKAVAIYLNIILIQ